MGAMFNKPAPASDYIVLASCSVYLIGLLIGFKWELLGGLISLGFLVIAIIYFIYYESNYRIYILIFILMIPCILYIISWYFHREFEINHILHENSKDEYSIIFGKGTIDLSNVDLGNGNVKVNINTIFGHGLIKINPEIPMIIDIDSAFASAKLPDKTITSFGSYTYKTKSFAEEKPYLKIKIDVVFGAVDITESQ